MTKAAQLGAGDLVPAFLDQSEMHADLHPRHGVLLEAQSRHEKVMRHILRAQDEVDWLVDRHDYQADTGDVILTRWIFWIHAHRIVLIVIKLRIVAPELAIDSG